MLEQIKIMLGCPNDDSKDDILNTLIAICSEEYKDITHTESIIESIVIQMVICRYNMLGAEMISSESYTGMNYSYLPDYPENLRKQIIAHRKLRTIT